LSRQLGYKYSSTAVSTGEAQFYVKVPADSTGAPASDYYPTLRVGSQFTSVAGTLFTLTEDLYFGAKGNQILIGGVDASTNIPTFFVVKATGVVMSGRTLRETHTVGAFQKFLKIPLANPGVTQVLSVTDTEGHEYYEVSHLAQEVIYKSIRNNNADQNSTPSILKAVPATRRFVVETTRDSAFLQFGYGSDSELTNQSVVDPSQITLKVYGRDYTSSEEFDPTNLTSTDKFGVAPANTTLTITYRVNDPDDANISSNTLTGVTSPILEFDNRGALDGNLRTTVLASLEVNNEEPILGDVELPSPEEIKQRVFSYYATQQRAVTVEDYQAITYAMPPSYGSIKRCSVQRDFNAFKRNLNMYLVSEDSSGLLTATNSTLKQNLKTWLSRYKMINDTIDLLDARVVNFGIQFILVADYSENKFNVLSAATARLRNYFVNLQFDIGESLYISEVYKEIQRVPGVIDVIDVKIIPQVGGAYSDANFDFAAKLSPDGRYITAEKDSIFELKYPNIDIQGSIT